jgi:hypothetical protein
MADAAHEQIDIAAPPARCFAVATAFEDYPTWTSDVKQVRILERDALGRGRRVEFHVAGLGRRVRYVLEYDFGEAPHAFSWSMLEGDLLRALDGRYAFSPSAVGTHVDYRLRVELAVPLPGVVKRRASGMIMGNALRDLKRALESAPPPGAGAGGEQHMTADDPIPEPPPFEPARSELEVPHPEAVPFEEAGTEERPLPPPSILESVLTELLGAVPEVKDHVLEAADALLDAAKALLDAADRVVRQQRGDE